MQGRGRCMAHSTGICLLAEASIRVSGQAARFLQAKQEEERVRQGQFPHVPREIWEKICHLLTTKEVAQSLGPACMALHG